MKRVLDMMYSWNRMVFIRLERRTLTLLTILARRITLELPLPLKIDSAIGLDAMVLRTTLSRINKLVPRPQLTLARLDQLVPTGNRWKLPLENPFMTLSLNLLKNPKSFGVQVL